MPRPFSLKPTRCMKTPLYLLLGAGLLGTCQRTFETQAIDLLSGKPLPMLPNAAQLQAPTMEPGTVVAQQTQLISDQRLALAKTMIESSWAENLKATVTA